MMYLETPPRLIATQIFSAMPDEHRRKVRTDGADANRPGALTDCFIEGPSFDADGNLYIVDIPFGRIFRITPDKKWSLVVEYEGWPNGLKISRDGRIFVADYMHGPARPRAQTNARSTASRMRSPRRITEGLCARAASKIVIARLSRLKDGVASASL
jgi:gluconolactonase